MRVAVVCPYDLGAPGGVQQLCLELVQRLRDSGDDCRLIGPGEMEGAISAGSPVTVSANRSRVPIALAPGAIGRVRKAIEGFDVVHIHEPLVPLTGWAGLGRDTAGRVATFHADPARWTRALYRLGGPIATRALARTVLTAVSPVAADAIPPSWGPVDIIPNAIDTAAYRLEVERSPLRVVFLGRDEPRKGLDILLEAWPHIRAGAPEAELMVMGADRTNGPPGVTFLGRVEEREKRRLLATSPVLAAPNLGGESFGIVLAEAMAAGCAVVASDIPAFRAVLGTDGVLVPAGDRAALARAITALLTDPGRTAQLGRCAQVAATRFDWSAVLGSYRAAYESAIRMRSVP